MVSVLVLPILATLVASGDSSRAGDAEPRAARLACRRKEVAVSGDRPLVLVLGGGFAGIGAARELKKADADVVLVDKHDYHTFQPLLYQVATTLLEPDAVAHPLRDLFHEQPNARVHLDEVTAIDLAKREVQFAELAAGHVRLPRAGTRRRGQLLRSAGCAGARVPDVHARRRRPPEEAHPRQVGSGRQGRCARRGRRSERRGRRRRSNGRRECRRACGALPQQLRRGLSGHAQGAGPHHARRGLARAVRHVQGAAPHYTQAGAGGARRRGGARGDRRVGRADAGHAQVREGARGAHARVGRRTPGEPDRRVARPRAPARESHRGRAGSQHRRPSRGLRRGRHRLDHRLEDRRGAAAARLGRPPGGRAGRRRTSRDGWKARRPSPSATTTRARWRRSGGAPRSSSCRTEGR